MFGLDGDIEESEDDDGAAAQRVVGGREQKPQFMTRYYFLSNKFLKLSLFITFPKIYCTESNDVSLLVMISTANLLYAFHGIQKKSFLILLSSLLRRLFDTFESFPWRLLL